MDGVKTDISEIKEEFDPIKEDIDELKNRVTSVIAAMHTVTATTDGNGILFPPGETKVSSGGIFPGVIEPDRGFEIDAITVDGDVVEESGDFVIIHNDKIWLKPVEDDHEVHVTFKEKIYHDVKTSVGVGGNITPHGTTSVEEGSNFIATIAPQKNYVVKKITINGQVIINNATMHTVTIDAGPGGSIVQEV
jgi:hypothetical protein